MHVATELEAIRTSVELTYCELVQNADDAGARKFALVFDQRQHSADASRLFSPAMGNICPPDSLRGVRC